MLLSLHQLFNKKLSINYFPETRNGCDTWEQAFRRKCVDHLISSDADRWAARRLRLQSLRLLPFYLDLILKEMRATIFETNMMTHNEFPFDVNCNAFRVYESQLIRYAHCCSTCDDFLSSHTKYLSKVMDLIVCLIQSRNLTPDAFTPLDNTRETSAKCLLIL